MKGILRFAQDDRGLILFFSSSYPCLTAWAAFFRSFGTGLVAGGLRGGVFDCACGSGVPTARVSGVAAFPALKRWATFGRPSGTLGFAAGAFSAADGGCPHMAYCRIRGWL